MRTAPRLDRTTFSTSRLLDYLTQKDLIAQTGHQPASWPLVVLKELVDNALDAGEEAGATPTISVTLDNTGITVADNGPGLPAETIEKVLDFGSRVSSREAYVSPTRGAQGNALKTVLAMPFVLDGKQGRVDITAHGSRHEIICQIDRIRQCPVISHEQHPAPEGKKGTVVRVHWPVSACSILAAAKDRFLQIADDYTWLNPHLTLTVRAFDEEPRRVDATAPRWKKWGPSDPTSPHWYQVDHLRRLLSYYVAHDEAAGRPPRTVREVVAEFRGLTGTAKQRAVLEATGMARMTLASFVNGRDLDPGAIERLLAAMQAHSKPVKPAALGAIGRAHLLRRFEALGVNLETFNYAKTMNVTNGLPWVVEAAFGWCQQAKRRRDVLGVNWSPGLLNPFRELGTFGGSLDAILEQQRVGRGEPVVFVLHVARPRIEFSDRGKSAAVIEAVADDEDAGGAMDGKAG